MSDHKPGVLRSVAQVTGEFAVRHAAVVMAVIFIFTVVLAIFAGRVQQEDDVIRFLPEDDPEVVKFREIGDRFGGLSIAIVGVEVQGEGQDLFTAERLRAVRELDERLSAIDGVNATTTFTELPDIVESQTEDGRTRADLHDLVGNIPARAGPELEAFVADVKARAMARDYVVGSLVSEDGSATIVLCQIAPDAPMKDTADAIRAEAQDILGDESLGLVPRFGGAPFVGSFAAENTRRDLIALSPWVCLAVILIMLITSRSISSVVIALFSVGVGIVWVMGGLELMGGSLTLVSSSLPVLLVALGSAYSVHLLAAILAEIDANPDKDKAQAISHALGEVGPPIIAAGLTTAAGFVSFLIMDIAPMREFGVLMTLATLLIVALTLFVVPAAAILLPMKSRPEGRAPAWALAGMVGAARRVAANKLVAVGILVAIIGAAGYYALTVRAHTDIRTLFAEDSEPVQAEDFLQNRFGGSLFLQLELAGDIKSPVALRQLERITLASSEPEGVTRVQSIATAVVLASYSTTGERRIPPNRDTSAALGSLVQSDPSARLLVTKDWDRTLLQVQLGAFDISRAKELASELETLTEPLLGKRAMIARSAMSAEARTHERTEIVDHIEQIIVADGRARPPREPLESALGSTAMGELREKVAKELRYNLVEDPMLTLADEASIDQIVDKTMALLANGEMGKETFHALLVEYAADEEKADEENLKFGTGFVFGAVEDIGAAEVRLARIAAIQAAAGDLSPSAKQAIERAIWPLSDPVASVPAALAGDAERIDEVDLSLTVSGYPLVYGGMNESVQRNQVGSLLASFVLVLVALMLFFRSPLLAVIAAVPAVCTLLVTFGLMGFLKIPMDVGTSMVAAIALGVGIDYAVHLLWRHGRPEAARADGVLEESLGATGWGIVINALEVSAGLSLLALGTIVPMRSFGILTATAMIVSAIFTLLFVPALARRGARKHTNARSETAS